MQRCNKCGETARAVRRDATCELHPAVGFKSPCLLNERRRLIEEATSPSLIPIKVKTKSKRTKEKRHAEKGL